MGLINLLLNTVFGDGRNVIRETAQVFRENAEFGAARDLDRLKSVLEQHGREFGQNRARFDVIMDGVNRLPRPTLAFGTIGLFAAAMSDPIWFAERMQGLALVPEPLWWLMGAVVSFYFGARHQLKGQEFQREMVQTMARVPQVIENTRDLQRLRAIPTPDAPEDDAPNAALTEWRAQIRSQGRSQGD